MLLEGAELVMNALVEGNIVQGRRLRVKKEGVYKRSILFVTLADISRRDLVPGLNIRHKPLPAAQRILYHLLRFALSDQPVGHTESVGLSSLSS